MTRRQLAQASTLAASLFGLPASAATASPKPLPGESLLHSDPEAYWRRIREEQFLLPGWRAYFNNGSLGVAPRPVVQAVTNYIAAAATLESEVYPRWGYETMDEFRQELAAFYGCQKDELALTHNATEGMSIIAAGLNLKPEDEVLITDQEHPSGRGCWHLRAARQGITVREVKIPIPPQSSEQLADIVISAIGPKTRVLSFSGILTTTGLIMPVRQICDAARAKGVITVLDAAHMHGQIPFQIRELHCDYMAGSPHKWMFAPAGSGLLYIREENLTRLWPTVVSGNWDDTNLKAARFMTIGTNNRAILEGMMAGLRFSKRIGPDRIYQRLHQMAAYLRQKAQACPHVELLTPDNDNLYAGLVAFRFKTKDLAKFHALLAKRHIWSQRSETVRLATHIHTRRQDIDAYFETMRETLGRS